MRLYESFMGEGGGVSQQHFFRGRCKDKAYWSFQPWSSTPATLCIHSSTSRFS